MLHFFHCITILLSCAAMIWPNTDVYITAISISIYIMCFRNGRDVDASRLEAKLAWPQSQNKCLGLGLEPRGPGLGLKPQSRRYSCGFAEANFSNLRRRI